MKKFGKLLSVALLLTLTLTISCKKDDPAPSKTSLLAAKSWSITKIEVQFGSSPVTDATSDFQSDCEKDDLIKFGVGGVLTTTVGTDDCDGDETPETGTWAFKTNETILETVTDSDTEEWTVISLTSTLLKLKQSEPYDSNGDGTDDSTATLFYTFTAK